MRRFLRYTIRVLLLIVVFMVSALTAMRFAIHGRQTTIPKLVGMTMAQAERQLADHGLLLERGDRFFSTDVAPGRVMAQAPSAGVQVRRGWHVRVAESMGPQRVAIPNLLGDSERASEINIRRRGLELGSVAEAVIPGRAADLIVAQSPPPNALNVSAPKISILVAAPETPHTFVMPDFVGQSEDDAIRESVAAGLHVGSISSEPVSASDLSPSDAALAASRTVLKTVPAAGQRVAQGQGISLVVTR